MLLVKRPIRSFNFKTGISAATPAILETEQLTSPIRIAMMDTFTSVQGSDGEDIPVSEVYDLLSTIHNILDNTVLKGLVICLSSFCLCF